MPDHPETITPGTPVRYLWPLVHRGDSGNIGTRAMTCLRRGQIGTVGELTAMTAEDIDDIRLAGPAVVEEIRRVLAAHGRSLKGDNWVSPADLQARMRVLAKTGLRRPAAMRFARRFWPSGEIAPGVVLTVTGDGRG